MYLDLTKPNNNGLILENSTREMKRTHQEVRMARTEMDFKMDF